MRVMSSQKHAYVRHWLLGAPPIVAASDLV